jgi:hypothetical protein
MVVGLVQNNNGVLNNVIILETFLPMFCFGIGLTQRTQSPSSELARG